MQNALRQLIRKYKFVLDVEAYYQRWTHQYNTIIYARLPTNLTLNILNVSMLAIHRS